MRAWLETPMTVSYGQVLTWGGTLLVLAWLVSTLALWLYEERRLHGLTRETLRMRDRHFGQLESELSLSRALKQRMLDDAEALRPH